MTTAPSSVLSSALSSTAAVEQSVVSGSRFTTAATVLTVSSLVSGTACPTLQFMISTYVIRTSAATQYDSGSCTSLKAGTKFFMEGASEAPQTFNATLISFSTDTTTTPTTPAPTPAPTPVQTQGTVTATTGACPDLVFNIGSYVFKITSATLYSGATCADVKTGVGVYVAGTKREGDSFVLVTGLGIRKSDTPGTTPTVPTTPTTPTTPGPVAAEVIVTSLVGTTSCPALSFMVGGYTIVTSASTHFEYGACTNLKAGSKIALTGSKSGDTTIVASNIAFRDGSTTTPPTSPTGPTTPSTPVVGAEVTVSSLVGTTSCPALSFMVGGYTIVTSASTHFENGVCANLKAGSKIALTGSKNGDTTVVASNIAFRDGSTTTPGGTTPPSDRPRTVEGDGVISSVSAGTACPTLQFLIGSYVIKLDATTQFEGGACADIKASVKVGVKGTYNDDGSVTATRISIHAGAEPHEVEGEGRVSGLKTGTSCPALVFFVDGYTVTLDASTTFVEGTCSAIAADTRVHVKGLMTGTNAVTATQITVQH